MKKIILAVAVVAMLGLGMSSCKNENGKCWKVTYTAGALGVGTEVTVYWWLSDAELEVQKERYEREGYTSITAVEMPNYKTKAGCIALGNATDLLE